MRKFLEKLPIEGLLIIIVALISLIVLLYLTKVDSIINSNGKIVVQEISEDSKEILFTENVDDLIKLDQAPPKEVEEESQPVEKRKVRIFFIKVNNDGEIITKGVLKSIYTGKTPLSKSIERLLHGPDTGDINSGLLTLIPEGSELLSITIKEKVAYINFNEMFRFNPLGVEGYIAQIKQIVYTATEYDSVSSVQFLIDGAIQDYLGPEGVYIGRPISRDDLD